MTDQQQPEDRDYLSSFKGNPKLRAKYTKSPQSKMSTSKEKCSASHLKAIWLKTAAWNASLCQHGLPTTIGSPCPFTPFKNDYIKAQKRTMRNTLLLASPPLPRFRPIGSSRSKPDESGAKKNDREGYKDHKYNGEAN